MLTTNDLLTGVERKSNIGSVVSLQRKLFALEQGNFEVLASDEFSSELTEYLTRLNELGYTTVVKRVLENISSCDCRDKPELRKNIDSISMKLH